MCKKKWFKLNQIAIESKPNWFFPELIQEERTALFYKTNSVNQIVSTKPIWLTELISLLFEISSSKTTSKLVRFLEPV